VRAYPAGEGPSTEFVENSAYPSGVLIEAISRRSLTASLRHPALDPYRYPDIAVEPAAADERPADGLPGCSETDMAEWRDGYGYALDSRILNCVSKRCTWDMPCHERMLSRRRKARRVRTGDPIDVWARRPQGPYAAPLPPRSRSTSREPCSCGRALIAPGFAGWPTIRPASPKSLNGAHRSRTR
jgi:hypothetical protein